MAQLEQLVNGTAKLKGWYNGVKAADFWRVWHILQFDIGERTSAMLAIEWEWIDWENEVLRIPAEVRKGTLTTRTVHCDTDKQ